MINSNSVSTGVQTQFYLPSYLYKKSFNSSPLLNASFNFRNTDFKNPLISIKKTRCQLPNASTSDGVCVYAPLPEETLYDLLGISQSGTFSDIKRAYKQMALKYHPDVSPPDRVDEYTVRFIRVQEAYKTLSDPESRAVYDCNLAKGLHLAFSGRAKSRGRCRWRAETAEHGGSGKDDVGRTDPETAGESDLGQ